jgi:hypothetical protein
MNHSQFFDVFDIPVTNSKLAIKSKIYFFNSCFNRVCKPLQGRKLDHETKLEILVTEIQKVYNYLWQQRQLRIIPKSLNIQIGTSECFNFLSFYYNIQTLDSGSGLIRLGRRNYRYFITLDFNNDITFQLDESKL